MVTRRNKKNNYRQRKQPQRKQKPRNRTGQSATAAFQIPITIGDHTKFTATNISLDPSTYTTDMVSAQASVYQKYKVLSAGVHWTSSAGIELSGGQLAIMYFPDEARGNPTTTGDAYAFAVQGVGQVFPVKQHTHSWTVPRGALKNITEGYTMGDTQVPGRIILATTALCDVASPGTLTLKVRYQFFGRATPKPTTPEELQIAPPIGGYTLDLIASGDYWPDGVNPSGTWALLPQLIKSCYPPSAVEYDQIYVAYIQVVADSDPVGYFGVGQGLAAVINSLMEAINNSYTNPSLAYLNY